MKNNFEALEQILMKQEDEIRAMQSRNMTARRLIWEIKIYMDIEKSKMKNKENKKNKKNNEADIWWGTKGAIQVYACDGAAHECDLALGNISQTALSRRNINGNNR